MYSAPVLFKKFLRHYFRASNGKGHGIHSPFVFDFINAVLLNKYAYYPDPLIEAARYEWLKDKRVIEVEDYGAGSFKGSSQHRTIQSIARNAAKPEKWAKMLYRLARHYKPTTIVELGTSLGISGSYMALACPHSTVITIEGSKAIQAAAAKNFEKLGIKNICSLQGHFDQVLPEVLQKLPAVDLAFIDGNHRKDATIDYFNQFLKHKNQHAIFVFDDIHWSKGMEEAWAFIKDHVEGAYTIDLFFIGLVFFRPEFKATQHFRIKF